MTSFIRVTEDWVPSRDGTVLEFSSGSYGDLDGFHAESHQTVFGFDEGLPGRAWATRRPIVLKDLQNSYFRRGAAAAAAGPNSGRFRDLRHAPHSAFPKGFSKVHAWHFHVAAVLSVLCF